MINLSSGSPKEKGKKDRIQAQETTLKALDRYKVKFRESSCSQVAAYLL